MASPLSLLSFVGVACATFAPAMVLVWTAMGEPMLMVLAIFSAFFYAASLALTALVWLALVPLRQTYPLLVLYAVALQEAARWGTWSLSERLMRGLRSVGLVPHDVERLPNMAVPARAVPAAVACGVGFGVMQALVMHGDVLFGSLRPGTLYSPSCSSLSVFAVDALTNLAYTLLHVLLSILGWTCAYPRGSIRVWAAIVVLHLLASASTLFNTQIPITPTADRCAISLTCLYAVVVGAAVLTARVALSSLCATHGCEAQTLAISSTSSGGRAR